MVRWQLILQVYNQILYMSKYSLPTVNSHDNDLQDILLTTDWDTYWAELFLLVKCNQSGSSSHTWNRNIKERDTAGRQLERPKLFS